MKLSDTLESNTFFRNNGLKKLEKLLKNYNNILLFTGKKSFHLCGAEKYFNGLNGKFNFNRISYSGIALPIEDVEKKYKKARQRKNIDLIIALGGVVFQDVDQHGQVFVEASEFVAFPSVSCGNFGANWVARHTVFFAFFE